jgi:hypothetical protein
LKLQLAVRLHLRAAGPGRYGGAPLGDEPDIATSSRFSRKHWGRCAAKVDFQAWQSLAEDGYKQDAWKYSGSS